MKKLTRTRLVLSILAILIIAALLSACSSEAARLPATYTYSPGPAFTANINDPEPRRVVKCAVVFEVIDESATTDLAAYNYAIRNAVLIVLGELTFEELTNDRDLEEIAHRITERVNDSLRTHVDVVQGTYFTEFILS